MHMETLQKHDMAIKYEEARLLPEDLPHSHMINDVFYF